MTYALSAARLGAQIGAQNAVVEETRVSREELYEKVWTEPVRTVAKGFGVSDVALAKQCKKLKIPLPGRGYWSKKPRGRACGPFHCQLYHLMTRSHLELGVEASDRLVGKNHVVLVEGRSDAQFFAAVLRILFAAGHVNLNPAELMFLQRGGIGSLLYTVTERCMDEVNLHWAAVTDSDRPMQGAPEADHVRAVRAAIPASCRLFYALTYSRIENYMNPADVEAVANVRCDISRYEKPTTPGGGLLRDRLVKQIKDAPAQTAEHRESRA
jgi:hypothetical protein